VNTGGAEQTDPTYLQDLEYSRPYQNATRQYKRTGIVTLEDIVFPATSDEGENATNWAHVTDDSSIECEELDDDHASCNSFAPDVLSVSTSFDLDTHESIEDEHSKKIIKDIYLYDAAKNAHKLVCLLDTGATIDCISEATARKIQWDSWLRKSNLPLAIDVGGGHNTCSKYVVKAVWQFIGAEPTYKIKLHVTNLDNLPYDVILSYDTIFHFGFLKSTMDCFLTSHIADGIERLLPLGVSRALQGTFLEIRKSHPLLLGTY
jgi:hypothetical protein